MRQVAISVSLLLAFAAIFSACTSSDTSGPVEGTISVSERLSFNSDEVLVEFVEVTSDSINALECRQGKGVPMHALSAVR